MRKPSVLPVVLTEDELQQIVKAAKPQYKAAFLLGFYQCLRLGEICKLQPENVDTGRKLIYILQGKNSKDRTIPIAPQLIYGLKSKLPVKPGRRALEIALKKICKKILMYLAEPSWQMLVRD